ncbi:succinyl-CoA synthetase subunit beta [uncultured Tateyamaria sp.]|uniref:succinyl-CoA synthetase subunit beta n=1 Tax=uncultured Tateyamaria sp. TaxID=455651 RepID=UPI00262A43B0|nr:succinyl-CoA synthetase subunit beta [uncultured Tateyamaria sp.]
MTVRAHIAVAFGLCAALAAPAGAGVHPAISAFADHCFSPFLTAATAAAHLSAPGARVAFYDLDPVSAVASSPSDNVAPGTDRRCSVAIDGNHVDDATWAVENALMREGITDPASVPGTYAQTDGTALLAARYLNPNRIAVVIVETRPGTNGIETHMTVERLLPLDK